MWPVRPEVLMPAQTAGGTRLRGHLRSLLNCCLLALGKFGSHFPEIKVELKARGAGSLVETYQLGSVPAGLVSPQPSSVAEHPTPLGVGCQGGSRCGAPGCPQMLPEALGQTRDPGRLNLLYCAQLVQGPLCHCSTPRAVGATFTPPHISFFVPPISCWALVSQQCLSCPSGLPLLPVALLGPECDPAVLSFRSAMLGVGGALPDPAGLHSS